MAAPDLLWRTQGREEWVNGVGVVLGYVMGRICLYSNLMEHIRGEYIAYETHVGRNVLV